MCNFFFIAASESEPLIKEFCDNSVSVIYSTGQYMTITFTTDGSFSRQGFHLAFDSLLQSAVLTARTACESIDVNDDRFLLS